MLIGNGSRCALLGVDTSVVLILGIRVVLLVHVAKAAIPVGVSSESTLVVDTPSEDLVIVGQRDRVHATAGDLDDAGVGGGEVIVESGTLHIDGLLVVDALAAETELARRALAKDVDIEDLGGRVVDLLSDLGVDLLLLLLGSGLLDGLLGGRLLVLGLLGLGPLGGLGLGSSRLSSGLRGGGGFGGSSLGLRGSLGLCGGLHSGLHGAFCGLGLLGLARVCLRLGLCLLVAGLSLLGRAIGGRLLFLLGGSGSSGLGRLSSLLHGSGGSGRLLC